VEIEGTPFFSQDKFQCGPAALATLLGTAGVAVTPEELVPVVYIPDLKGSLQSEMISVSRTYGRIPYEIEPDFAALIDELDAGRPVLVLQNLGVSFAPAWHYAVVIGYSARRSEIILRSGTTRRRVTAAGTFLRTWRRSDYWGIVLLGTHDIPQTVDPDRYLRAVAAAESAGQLDLALPAYTEASNRWPEMALPRLGIGNAMYSMGDLDAAELWYRRYLEARPGDPVGANNLATVLMARGSCDEALGLIRNALESQDEESQYRKILQERENELFTCRSDRP
jgi:tetratricopeptide (TPR) repeat protein